MYSKHTLLLCTVLFTFIVFNASAQKLDSDLLLKQAIYETNVTKNYEKAISLAKTGLRVSPDYLDIRQLLGRLYLLQGNYAEGKRELDRVLLKQPENKDALNYLINAAFAQKNYADALAYSSTFISRHPDDKDAILKRVGILAETNAYRTALLELEKAMQRFPGDSRLRSAYLDYLNTYGSDLRERESYLEAIPVYEQILKIDTANEIALNSLFAIYLQLGRSEEALQYASAIERLGTTPGISIKKADLLRSMGRYEEANTVVASLLEKNTGDSSLVFLYKDIQFTQAKLNLESGDTVKALMNYKDLLSRYPSDTTARNLIINIHLEQQDNAAALEYINSGMPYYRDQSSLYLRKIEMIRSEGDLKEAFRLSDSLVSNNLANSKVERLRDELFVITRQNRIGLSTSVTMFDQEGRDPWKLHSLWYLREEKNLTYLGRVNYADRVNFQGYQFELEAYPKHGKSYSFVNIAYSQSMVFPDFKFSYSYFLPVGKGIEAELGVRYLKADRDFKGLTGALSRSFNRYWANLKTFQTSSNGKLVGSYIITNRYYFSDLRDDYFSAIAGYGFSPEDVARNFDFVERVNLESLRFTLGYQKTVFNRGILGIFGTWNNQEYTPGKKRNEYDVSLSYQHKF